MRVLGSLLVAVSCFAADVNAPEPDGTTPLHWAVRADDLAKVNGKWFFTKRRIYNEGRDEWAYKGGKNPAW